jgi:hypothetical protein
MPCCRDDDGTRPHRRTMAQLDRIGALIAIQLHRRVRRPDFRAEFLRLNPRARGQGQARNAGGKSQIVLDFGARSRLAAGRARFEHKDIEPFGRCVYRGSQPRGACAHDDEVPDPVVVDLLIHSQTRGHLFIAGILEHRRAPAQHHGHVVGADVKTIQQILHARVRVHVEVDVGKGVSRQELLQTQRPRGMARAQQDDVARLRGDQPDAPEDESAHEEFAEFGVGLNDRAQPLLGDYQHLAPVPDARSHQAADARQRAHLSREAARRVHHHQYFAAQAGLNHFDAAGQDHEHRTIAIAGLRQYLALRHGPVSPMGFQPGDLRIRQYRKHLRFAAEERRPVGQAYVADGHAGKT